MPKLQAFIFDLDGTLVDSAPDLRHALNATLAEHGRRNLSLDELKAFLGDGMLTMLQRAFVATGAPLANDESYRVFQGFVEYYRKQPADTAAIYPHVRDLLEECARDGIKLGLCTNKQEAATHRLLEELDLARYFGFVAGGDTFMTHKPHPDHVRGVIKALDVPTEGCVMVGDSVNDVRAAQGAGIPCLVVTHGYGIDIAELGADGLIGGMDELRAVVTGMGYA